MSFEEDLAVVGGGVGDSPCRTRLLDPMPAEFTEGRGDSGAFKGKVVAGTDSGQRLHVRAVPEADRERLCHGRIFSKGQGAGSLRHFQHFHPSGRLRRKAEHLLCPTCGSSIFWEGDTPSDYLGVAPGCFADPSFHLAVMMFDRRPAHPPAMGKEIAKRLIERGLQIHVAARRAESMDPVWIYNWDAVGAKP
jgi:hypothetical protein